MEEEYFVVHVQCSNFHVANLVRREHPAQMIMAVGVGVGPNISGFFLIN